MGYQDYVTILSFFYNWSIILQACFIFTDILNFYIGNIISRTFPDLVKFKDISRTWKMNLFSWFPRRVGNPYLQFASFVTFQHFDTNWQDLGRMAGSRLLLWKTSHKHRYGSYSNQQPGVLQRRDWPSNEQIFAFCKCNHRKCFPDNSSVQYWIMKLLIS